MSKIWLTNLIVRCLAATQIHSSLLGISVGAVLMPAAYHFSLSWRTETTATDQKSAILKMSHGVRAFF
jgi:Ca2+:H+ antiporter